MQLAISNLGVLIPNLVLLLGITAAAFTYASNMAPMILLVSSVLLLLYAIHLNRTQFASDYKYSTWQRGMIGFAPLITVCVVLVAIYGGFALVSKSPGVMLGGRKR